MSDVESSERLSGVSIGLPFEMDNAILDFSIGAAERPSAFVISEIDLGSQVANWVLTLNTAKDHLEIAGKIDADEAETSQDLNFAFEEPTFAGFVESKVDEKVSSNLSEIEYQLGVQKYQLSDMKRGLVFLIGFGGSAVLAELARHNLDLRNWRDGLIAGIAASGLIGSFGGVSTVFSLHHLSENHKNHCKTLERSQRLERIRAAIKLGGISITKQSL